MAVIYLGIGWFLGLWLAATIDLGVAGWLAVSALGVAGFALFRRRARLLPVVLCLAAVGLGGHAIVAH